MKFRLAIALAFVAATTVQACTYCDPANLKQFTLRQEARTSRFVVIGTLSNPRLVGEQGATDLNIDVVVKDDPALAKRTTITLPRWTPVDAKKPPKLLVFFDVYDGKLDPFRGVTLRGSGMPQYLRGALAVDERERSTALQYFFKHLDNADPDVAMDAFLEFAKATDREVGEVGPKLEPAKLRKLLADPKTPVERLSLFAFLLGACGTKEDAQALTALVEKGDERSSAALSGALGGLMEMRPAEGWKRLSDIIENPKRNYQDKLAALGTLRFYQAYRGADNRKQILSAIAAVVARGDMADMAIEDLRRWQWWELTRQILAQYNQPTHAAPLVKSAIIRYALCCPDAEAAAFIKSVRTVDGQLVRDIEEAIAFERPPAKPKP